MKMPVTGAVLARAVARALRFLLARQDGDGAWRDFECPPGSSEAWVTAHVAARLAPLLGQPLSPPLQQSVRTAVDAALGFLRHAGDDAGGWGYNRRCDSDCDTTAQVVLLFQAMSTPVSPRSYARLVRFQREDGSFATYESAMLYGDWARGHPEITAVAMRALSFVLAPDHVILRRGGESLACHLDGLRPWESYWWKSPSYLPLELERLYARVPKLARPATPPPLELSGCFDEAMSLEWYFLRSARTHPVPLDATERDEADHASAVLLRRLLDSQENDGGWPAQPILKLPLREVRGKQTPPVSSAPLVVDGKRLFTTATVLQALATTSAPMWTSSPVFE